MVSYKCSYQTINGFVRRVIQEQTGLQIDQPDPRGGTISTGNVARRAFSDESNLIECDLSLIEVQHRSTVHSTHYKLASVPRNFNSDRKVNTEKLGNLCQESYYSRTSLIQTPTDGQNLFALSGVRIKRSNFN